MIDRRDPHVVTGRVERSRGLDHGLVLDARADDAAAGVAASEAQGRQVVRLAAGPGEDDPSSRGAECREQPIPGLLHGDAARPTICVQARRIAELLRQVRFHRRPYLRAERSGRGVIEIDGFFAHRRPESAQVAAAVLA